MWVYTIWHKMRVPEKQTLPKSLVFINCRILKLKFTYYLFSIFSVTNYIAMILLSLEKSQLFGGFLLFLTSLIRPCILNLGNHGINVFLVHT